LADFNGLKILYALIILFFMYVLNRWFVFIYRTVPFRIESSEQGLQCSAYSFSRKQNVVEYASITDITGGVFDRRFNKLITIKHKDGAVAFFTTISGSALLQNVLLQNINKPLYDEIMRRIGAVDK
jgi:hypothetical protein